jgi:hypothetical protein
VLVVTSLVALLLLVVWYLLSYQAGGGSVGGVMGQMMGGGSANNMMTPMPGYVWVAITAIALAAVAGVVGLVYYLAYPRIKTEPPPLSPAKPSQMPTSAPTENWAAIIRSSKPEEKRVLEVLAAHDGSYLQKFIVKEAGLSRLKTHRIVARLAERGIVSAVKSGNTNEISLASWLVQDLAKSKRQAI